MKTAVFILLEIIVALVLKSLVTIWFASKLNSMSPLDWANYLSMITAGATIVAICVVGVIYLKYTGKLSYAAKSLLFCVIGVAAGVLVLKIVGLLAALALATDIVFTGITGIIVTQLPLAGGVIGFNFFLFRKNMHDSNP